MNEDKYCAKFKCRMCGEIFISGDNELNKKTARQNLYDVMRMTKTPFITHFCEDGNMGLADFIGMQKEEQEEDYPSDGFPF